MDMVDYQDIRTGKKCELPFTLSPYAISLSSTLINDPLNNESRAMLIEHLNETGESFAGVQIKGKGTVKCVHGVPTEFVCQASDWFRKPTKDGKSLARTVCDLLPITIVTLEGIEPHRVGGSYFFWRGELWEGAKMWHGGNIPKEWFEMIDELFPKYKFGRSHSQPKEHMIAIASHEGYATTLSISALNVGRRRAKLQLIEPKK